MERKRVESSMLAAVTYDEPSQTLFVEFNSGRIYAYINVPHSVCTELLSAESAGQYFNREIRPKFEYVELRRRLAR